MKIKSLFTLTFLLLASIATTQNLLESDDQKRTITVTGSASMNVMPDEIILSISLEEYWEEQFLPNAQKDDFKTKITIDKIETDFFSKINKIGIPRDSILLESSGRSWYWYPLSVVYKNYKISVLDFETADKILFEMDFYGIQNIKISELKNKNIPEYRQEVKSQAMIAAKDKAAYLLETIDEELGKVISVREQSSESHSLFSRSSASAYSNVMMGSSGDSRNEDNFRSIPLHYEIEAVFEIKE